MVNFRKVMAALMLCMFMLASFSVDAEARTKSHTAQGVVHKKRKKKHHRHHHAKKGRKVKTTQLPPFPTHN